MNLLNRLTTAVFNVVLTPLEAIGPEFALLVVSGVFGVLALVIFKHISSQKGIKATKDKIKGHMIEIRLYQNDLALVSKAIGKVLLRNFQYLALNFGPFIPLAVPFALVVAQMVVRYGFDPVDVTKGSTSELLAGEATTLRIEFAESQAERAKDVTIELPDGVEAVSKLAANGTAGIVAQEVVATQQGEFDIVIRLGDTEQVKKLWARDPAVESRDQPKPRALQPERTGSWLHAFLWPAEKTLPSSTGIVKVSFVYPESDLGWLPLSGPLGVILWFLIASMAVGFAMLKPLGVQI